MKKRVLAILMSLALAATAFPEAAVFAASTAETAAGEGIGEDSTSFDESVNGSAGENQETIVTPPADESTTPAAESEGEEASSEESSAADSLPDSIAEDESVNSEPAEEEIPEEVETPALEEEEKASEKVGEGEAAEIQEGFYKIASGVNNKRHLSIENSSVSTGAKTVIGGRYNDLSNVFEIRKNDDDTYRILAYCSNMALTVTSGKAADNAEVSQKAYKGTLAQKWVALNAKESGYITIASALDGKFVLDVAGGKADYGRKIALYSANKTTAQNWKLVKVDNPADSAPKAGVYAIFNVASSKRVVDVQYASKKMKTNIWLYNYNGTVAQQFRFIPVGYGNLYTIINASSHHSIDAQWAGTTSKTNIWQYEVNGTMAQKWRVVQNADKTYTFLAAGSNLAFDLQYGKTDNKTNIWLYKQNGTTAQKWNLKTFSVGIGKDLGEDANLENGYYTIANISSGKKLSVKSAPLSKEASVEARNTSYAEGEVMQLVKQKDGTYRINTYCSKELCLTADFDNEGSVVQKKWSNKPSQKWKIVQSASGKEGFYLVSAVDPACVIAAANNNNGAVVKGVNSSGSALQRWKIQKTTPEKLENGTYVIQSALATNRYAEVGSSSSDNGANVQTWGRNNQWGMIWTVTYMGYSNVYKIKNHSGKVLDVTGGSTADGANVQQYKWNGTEAQLWRIIKKGKNWVILNVKSNKALDITGAKKDKGVNIQQYTGNNTAAQKWNFVKYDRNVEFPRYTDTALILKANGFFAGIKDGSTRDGAIAQIGKENHSLEQSFMLEPAGDGYFKIKNIASKKYLDVVGGSAAAGAKIDSYAWNNTSAQHWKVTSTGDNDGTFYIQSKCGGANGYLTATSTAAGTQLTQQANNGKTNQKWSFKKPVVYNGLVKIGNVYKYYKNGVLVRNSVSGDGKYLTNKDGTVIKGWGRYEGFYYYFKAEKGRETMDQRPYISSLFGTRKSKTNNITVPKCDYFIEIDTMTPCTMTVYTKYPGTNSWNLPLFSVLCSPGRGEYVGGEYYGPTDWGSRRTGSAHRWKELMGPSYGQYATQLLGYSYPAGSNASNNVRQWTDFGEYTHSVACDAANDHNLNPGTYNLLGTRQSHGCVRLPVRYAYWIYEFVPNAKNTYNNVFVNNFNGGKLLKHPLKRLKTPSASTAIDPTDPAYTGNYGYTDTQNWKHWGGGYLRWAGT